MLGKAPHAGRYFPGVTRATQNVLHEQGVSVTVHTDVRKLSGRGMSMLGGSGLHKRLCAGHVAEASRLLDEGCSMSYQALPTCAALHQDVLAGGISWDLFLPNSPSEPLLEMFTVHDIQHLSAAHVVKQSLAFGINPLMREKVPGMHHRRQQCSKMRLQCHLAKD